MVLKRLSRIGQNKDVIEAMSDALEKCGAGVAEQEISQGQILSFCLNRNWQTFMGKTQFAFYLWLCL